MDPRLASAVYDADLQRVRRRLLLTFPENAEIPDGQLLKLVQQAHAAWHAKPGSLLLDAFLKLYRDEADPAPAFGLPSEIHNGNLTIARAKEALQKLSPH